MESRYFMFNRRMMNKNLDAMKKKLSNSPTKYDKEGNALSGDSLKNFNGPTFSSAEEASQAVDRRYSYATGETDANRAGLMGNKKRANIFGN